MQIKQSIGGRTVQVYRSVYVPEKKRSTQLLLLTFPSHCTEIPKNALEKVKPGRKLTDDELKEVQAWLDKRQVDREESILKYSVASLPLSIAQATEGLKHGITNEQAQAIYDRIDTLTKAIRKAGFARAKKKPVQQVPEPPQKKKPVSKKTMTKKVEKKKKKIIKKAKKKNLKKEKVKKVSKKKIKKSAGKKRKN